LSKRIPKNVVFGFSSSRERRKAAHAKPVSALNQGREGEEKQGMPEGARSTSAGTDVKLNPAALE
jgi:hypothetical protein